jgi:hypothetical protein
MHKPGSELPILDSRGLANMHVKPFFDMIDQNALPKLRAALAITLKLSAIEEQYLLRGLATRAASRGQRDIMEYGIPLLGSRRQDQLPI